jgi:hypothetical protein
MAGGSGSDRLDARDASSGDDLDGGADPDKCLTDRGDTRLNCP